MNSKYLIEKLFSYSLKSKLIIISGVLLLTLGAFGLIHSFLLNKTVSIKKTAEVKGQVSSISPTPTPQENKVKVIISNTIIATGVYDYSGTRTSISIQFPENGGRVTGNVTDECNGSVTGVYDGKESLNGNATGTCKIFNNSLFSQASYGGIVYKDQKKIVVNFQGTSESYSHKGTVTLYFK